MTAARPPVRAPIRAYVALGANLGEARAALEDAVRALASDPDIALVAVAPLYRTAPVGGPEQPAFLNSAIAVDTGLDPHALLHRLQALERAAGRVRRERWGPRVLDLDLLLYGNAVLNSADLVLPHPRLHERRFVLVPLAAIAAGVRHPVLGRSVAELLDGLPAEPGDVVLAAADWLAA